MNDAVIIDTNLLLLYVVGSASEDYVSKHRRLQDYTINDFYLISRIISRFSKIVLVPHVLTETSNLAYRYISEPLRSQVQAAFRKLVLQHTEVLVPSVLGVRHADFFRLGLTDAVILHLCSVDLDGFTTTLLTSDQVLANIALSLGYSAIDYTDLPLQPL